MMEYAEDHYTLSTGRRFYANNGILGLAPADATLWEGYDGAITDEDDETEPDPTKRLSPVERREIATAMMERWRLWAGIPDALGEIAKMTNDPEDTFQGLWDVVVRVHQAAANVLVFRGE